MKKSGEGSIICIAVSEFLEEYAVQFLTSSQHTLKGYRITLKLYIEFLEDVQGITAENFNRHCFEKKNIEQWMIWLKTTRHCSPATCNNRLASLRTFIEYLSEQDITLKYLYVEAKQIKSMKCPKKHAKGMSRNAVAAILNAPDTSTKIGLRDVTFLTVLYGTAARLDEILSLKLRNVHLKDKNPYVTLKGKGNKTRSVYLLPRAVEWLKKYIQVYHGSDADPDHLLFYSRVGRNYKQLTGSAMDKRIKMYASMAHKQCSEVPLDAHAHQFRHAKATHWLEDGINIVEIQMLLGHASIETTMKYLDITDEQKIIALGTLEREKDKNIEKKWKNGSGSILEMCGLK